MSAIVELPGNTNWNSTTGVAWRNRTGVSGPIENETGYTGVGIVIGGTIRSVPIEVDVASIGAITVVIVTIPVVIAIVVIPVAAIVAIPVAAIVVIPVAAVVTVVKVIIATSSVVWAVIVAVGL